MYYKVEDFTVKSRAALVLASLAGLFLLLIRLIG